MTERQMYEPLTLLLSKLKIALQKSNRWSLVLPSQEALQSTQPFCCDTLPFEQWLQFILIDRFEMMIAQSNPLPSNIAISPMAEEAFKLKTDIVLLEVIADIDELLSGVRVNRSWSLRENLS